MTPGRTWVNFMLPFKAVGRPEESRTPKPLSERQHLKLVCLPIPPQDGSYGKVNVEFPGLNPNVYGRGESLEFVKRFPFARLRFRLVAPVGFEPACTG